jgi:hypothetical protein
MERKIGSRVGAEGSSGELASATPGKVTQIDRLGLAQEGLSGGSQPLPYLDQIQHAFGPHDVSGVAAHVGGPAAAASEAIGARAYATGGEVAFREAPDLHTAAHEAAHVVQQRDGVSLKGEVGADGDAYEQHADRVADLVVAGKSAVGELDRMAGGGGSGGAVVQRKADNADSTEQLHEDVYGDPADAHAPGPDTFKYVEHYMNGRHFDWDPSKGKAATAEILTAWLDFFWLHELHESTDEHPDGCDFNGSIDYDTLKVASLFCAEARHACLYFDQGMVRNIIVGRLAPLNAAWKARRQRVYEGKEPGPGDPNPPKNAPGPADQDSSTQTTLSWVFMPQSKVNSDGGASQITGQWQQTVKKNGTNEIDVTFSTQVTLTGDLSKQQITVNNIAAVAGLQWAKSFLQEFIQLQAMVLLQSTFTPGVAVTGQMSGPRLIASGQAQAGSQIVFTLPGTNKKVQFVIQAQGGPGTGGPSGNIGGGFQVVLD